MSEHYYSQSPQSTSSPKTWNDSLRGKQYVFTSDRGVFAKHTIDFGTRLLIEHFQEPDVPGDLLDLGCGYGPIGIVLADVYQNRQVVLADVNERALLLAQENAAANGVENVTFVRSNRFSQLAGRSFSAIVTNPPIRAGKKVVYAMFEESKEALLDGGELWIVIQKKQGAASAKTKLADLFSTVDLVYRKKGYYVFRAINI
ncbi:MAG TPA: class I SAM-dependent methyltransferase [Bacillota bacterium]|nr:class I SAM-dependent methyltransferase [Bacillota bacterium]